MAIKSRFAERATMWKLEPQKRWAPHFHALIWNVGRIPWQWLTVNWRASFTMSGYRTITPWPMANSERNFLPIGWTIFASMNWSRIH